MQTQKVVINSGTNKYNSQITFGIARFKKIKNTGNVALDLIEDICKKCPGLDEFTHKHNVSLDTQWDYYTHYENEGFFNIGTPTWSSQTLAIILKVKEAPKNLLEKVTGLISPKVTLRYSQYESVKKGESSKKCLSQELFKELKDKSVGDFEKDLKWERGYKARCKQEEARKQADLIRLKKESKQG